MTKAEPSSTSSKVSDFKFGKEIGHGSFSTVLLAKDLKSGLQCAAKVIDKRFISRQKMVQSVLVEKEVLRRLGALGGGAGGLGGGAGGLGALGGGAARLFPRLFCTFQDPERLYFVVSLAERGEILAFLRRLSCFDLRCTAFYAAELLLALEHLHGLAVVHRDLKPENVLLSADMHVKVCDFGSALVLDRPDLKCTSFTGTAQFVSPEMLGFGKENKDSDESDSAPSSASKDLQEPQDNSLAYMMDLWALGCIVYQFLSGRMPFHVRHSRHEYEIFQKIKNLDFEFPPGFDDVARDFVTQLLILDPALRLGSPSSGYHMAVKNHAFFTGNNIDFNTILNEIPPLLSPNIEPVVHDNNWDEIPVGFEAAWRFNIKKEFQEIEKSDKKKLIENQERNNPFHRFVKGRLIIKQGILYKRRGLFTRKRMFLLTEGPHLFYVDPDSMQLKNEITLSYVSSIEIKNEKVFYVITKKRTYFLEDPSGKADEWKQSIELICVEQYGSLREQQSPSHSTLSSTES